MKEPRIENAVTIETAKVGMRVWDVCTGWSKIVAIAADSMYPIETENSTYTESGRSGHRSECPSLFHGPVDLIGPPPPDPVEAHRVKDPKVGQQVFVLGHGCGFVKLIDDDEDNNGPLVQVKINDGEWLLESAGNIFDAEPRLVFDDDKETE